MNRLSKFALGCASWMACTLGHADDASWHPYHLHALSDLRAAQWQVEHRRPEDGEVQEDEMVLADEIGAAIQNVKRAAMDDGQDIIDFSPPTDADPSRERRLHAAMDLLRSAGADIRRPEFDAAARPRQRLSVLHIDAALHAGDGVNDRRE